MKLSGNKMETLMFLDTFLWMINLDVFKMCKMFRDHVSLGLNIYFPTRLQILFFLSSVSHSYWGTHWIVFIEGHSEVQEMERTLVFRALALTQFLTGFSWDQAQWPGQYVDYALTSKDYIWNIFMKCWK